MKVDVFNTSGKKTGSVNLDNKIYKIEPNPSAIRQSVLAELTNMRQGTHSTKNRAQVRGGGKKPWKQKGRGAARAGTIRSPLWKGGGVVFGPTPHKYYHKVTKKLSKLSRKSLFSIKLSNKSVTILDKLKLKSHKTSLAVKLINDLNLSGKKITILVNSLDSNFDLATRNLQYLYIVKASHVSSYDLIDCEHLIVEQDSIKDLNKVLTS